MLALERCKTVLRFAREWRLVRPSLGFPLPLPLGSAMPIHSESDTVTHRRNRLVRLSKCLTIAITCALSRRYSGVIPPKPPALHNRPSPGPQTSHATQRCAPTFRYRSGPLQSHGSPCGSFAPLFPGQTACTSCLHVAHPSANEFDRIGPPCIAPHSSSR